MAFILIPFSFLIWYGTGYASLTTLSVGLITILIFGVRASLGLGPWAYAFYGLFVELLMIWALRPNLQRLKDGTERRHGLPVKLQQLKEARRSKSGGKQP
jgi:glycerol-3-phosphate acyltransferase PlsY